MTISIDSCRAVGAGGRGGRAPPPLHILAAQLTLFKPERGGKNIPTPLMLAPRIFRPSYGPGIISLGIIRVRWLLKSFSCCHIKLLYRLKVS